MIRISTDTSNIRATMRRLHENAPGATEDAVVVMAAAPLRKVGLQSEVMMRRGTGRWSRGWLMAYNGLIAGRPHLSEFGLTALGLPRLRRSELVDTAYQTLRAKAERSAQRLREMRAARERMVRGATPLARNRPAVRKMDREIDRVSAFQLRADNEVQKFETALQRPGALVMFGKTTKRQFTLSNIERIFPEPFGASARVMRRGVRVDVEIDHHEPHAQIVESRRRLWSRALADLRAETGGFVVTGRATDAFLRRATRGMAPGTTLVRSVPSRIVAKRRIA